MVTDFGVPKVIGGQYNVLATDIYKQVVGQQNFEMGAVVGVILLIPAVFSFIVDRIVQRRQTALLSSRAVAYEPKPDPRVDRIFLVLCSLIAFAILAIVGTAIFASFATYWPYNLLPSFKNYNFDLMDGGGWKSYWNSLKLRSADRIFGAAIVFLGAYLVEKTPRFGLARTAAHLSGAAAARGARPGARARLHLLLQRPLKSAELHLRHDGDPGDLHDLAFLLGRASDRRHGAEADRQRVRDRRRVAARPGLAHVLPRDAAGRRFPPSSTSRSIFSSTR